MKDLYILLCPTNEAINNMIFNASKFKISKYIEDKLNDLGLNEVYSCKVVFDNGYKITIKGDEDFVEIFIYSIYDIAIDL